MEEIILKKELNELKSLKGELAGITPKNNGDFILKEKGKKGLKKLEDTMAELGCPINYEKIKPMEFYPLNFYAISLLVIKRLFDFDDKKIQEMGSFGFKAPRTIRVLARYLISLEKIIKMGPGIWKKYYTVGDLKITGFDKEEKYIILRLENFKSHPLHCQLLIGMMPTIIQLIVASEVTCEETKCIYRGDEYHEFLLKW